MSSFHTWIALKRHKKQYKAIKNQVRSKFPFILNIFKPHVGIRGKLLLLHVIFFCRYKWLQCRKKSNFWSRKKRHIYPRFARKQLDIQHCLLLLDVIRKGKEVSTYLRACFFSSVLGQQKKTLITTQKPLRTSQISHHFKNGFVSPWTSPKKREMKMKITGNWV